MSDLPDVPWDVNWDKDFEKNIDDLKDDGSFEKYRKQIIKIIENPIREGRYKKGQYKGLKTAHVSGSAQDVICFELTPGVNAQSEIEKLEEVYFHHITHWDNYDSALNSRKPADGADQYSIRIPYFGGRYDPERIRSDIYDFAKEAETCCVESDSWEDEYIEISGQIGSKDKEELKQLLPDAAEIDFDSPSPF